MMALNATTGDVIWQQDMKKGVSVGSGPAVDTINRRVVFGATDGVLRCNEAATGKNVWEYSTSSFLHKSSLFASPVLHNQTVFFATSAEKSNFKSYVIALNALNGEFKWRYATASGVASSPMLAVEASLLCVGDNSGALYALNVNTGTLRWVMQTSGV